MMSSKKADLLCRVILVNYLDWRWGHPILAAPPLIKVRLSTEIICFPPPPQGLSVSIEQNPYM